MNTIIERVPYHPNMPICLMLTWTIYTLEGCSCGGLAHVVVSDESKDSNESTHSTASNSTVAFDDFNANDATSSFDRLKVIYKKVGNNESQAFGVWQQLSESERTAAFAHTQRLQGDLSSRSYLYVYLRDKEWMKAM